MLRLPLMNVPSWPRDVSPRVRQRLESRKRIVTMANECISALNALSSNFNPLLTTRLADDRISRIIADVETHLQANSLLPESSPSWSNERVETLHARIFDSCKRMLMCRDDGASDCDSDPASSPPASDGFLAYSRQTTASVPLDASL